MIFLLAYLIIAAIAIPLVFLWEINFNKDYNHGAKIPSENSQELALKSILGGVFWPLSAVFIGIITFYNAVTRSAMEWNDKRYMEWGSTDREKEIMPWARVRHDTRTGSYNAAKCAFCEADLNFDLPSMIFTPCDMEECVTLMSISNEVRKALEQLEKEKAARNKKASINPFPISTPSKPINTNPPWNPRPIPPKKWSTGGPYTDTYGGSNFSSSNTTTTGNVFINSDEYTNKIMETQNNYAGISSLAMDEIKTIVADKFDKAFLEGDSEEE